MAASGSGLPEPGWLDDDRLEELVDLAAASPDAFDREFEKLDVLRKAQLRKFVYERHRRGDGLPAGFTLASFGERTADTRESNTDADAPVDAHEAYDPVATPASGEAELDLHTETAADEPTEAQSPDDRATDDATGADDEDATADDAPDTGDVLSLDDLLGDGDATDVDDLAALADTDAAATFDDLGDVSNEVASLDELMALDTSTPAPEESLSLDDLFADSASGDGSSDSLDALFASDDASSGAGGDAMSLDDLFGGDDSGGGDMSLDDLMSMDAPAAAVEELVEEEEADAGADYPIPADYGSPIPVDMSAEEMCDIVQPLPLYAGIEHGDLLAICEKMEAIRYEPGSLLCRDGDDGDVMWLVHQGGIRVLPQGKDLDIVKAEGVVVGEMSLLDGAVRSATLVCEGDTILLRFDLASWTATFRDAPEAGLAFLRNLARMQQDEMRRTTEKAVA
ncbi:cyclic nucleotide-binding domain-containing protein, partial [Candidatus Poribacteria bacterium]|nr:cyclic nucleotide-binding domain-containing protein [Candidatus Poribacteria bacterium]